MTPTPQQLEAILRLRSLPEFRILREVVEDTVSERQHKLVQATDVPVIHRIQGGIMALQELVRLFDSAPATLEKLKGSKEKTR